MENDNEHEDSFPFRWSARLALHLFVFSAWAVGLTAHAQMKVAPASRVLTLDGSESYVDLEPHIDLYEDPTGLKLPADVTKPGFDGQFAPNEREDDINEGYSSSAYWARFTLHSLVEREWWIEYQYPLTDELEFYVFDEEGILVKRLVTGDRKPFQEREVEFRNFVIRMSMSTDERYTCYVRVKTSSTVNMPLRLWSSERFFKSSSNAYVVFGVYYGMIVVMMLYNLFLYATIQDRAYLFYVFSIGSILFFQITYNGLGYQYLWGNQIWFNHRAIPLSIAAMAISISQFNRYFLDTYSKAFFTDRILYWSFWISVVGALLTLFTPAPMISVAARGLIFFALFMVVMSLVAGVQSYMSGVKHARYYLIAWAAFLGGMTLQAMRALGVLPGNFVTTYGSQVGSAMEVILLALALADRINTLKAEIAERQLEEERIKRQQEVERKKIIEAQKAELETKVEERTHELKQAMQAIERSRKKMTDSIQYAQRIQNALMPDESQLRAFFPELFVLYKPRDIVSGDFFWHSYDETRDVCTVAVVDCTGHGVPGALVSVVGASQLDRIVNFDKVATPNEILDQLHLNVSRMLRQEDENSETRDGMDIALLQVHGKTKKLYFASAKIPLYLVKDGELTVIKGDKISVGGRALAPEGFRYSMHEIDMEPGLSVYMTSDGYADQFGGENDKKFGKKQLRKLLLQVAGRDMQRQHDAILQEHDLWRHENDQVDDITVIGMRF